MLLLLLSNHRRLKCLSCAWKADKLDKVGAYVYLVIDMVGWVWAAMGVVEGIYAGQRRGLVACGVMPENFHSAR